MLESREFLIRGWNNLGTTGIAVMTLVILRIKRAGGLIH